MAVARSQPPRSSGGHPTMLGRPHSPPRRRRGRTSRQRGSPSAACLPARGSASAMTSSPPRRASAETDKNPSALSSSPRHREPLRHANGGATALPRPRPASLAGCYSGPTPPLRCFEHPGDLSRAPATRPATAAVPRLVMISAQPVTSLEGRDPSGPSPYVRAFRPGIVSADLTTWPTISGARRQKRPLTPRRRTFAVRHRLRLHSPASPCGPFVVELFASRGFAPGTRARSDARSRLSPARELPTPAWVERTLSRARAPRGDSHPFDHHVLAVRRGLSLSPTLAHPAASMSAGHARQKGGRAIPNSLAYLARPPGSSDRTPGLIRPGVHRVRYTRGRCYSDEPPSNRTNTSPRIRLYGSTPRRLVSAAPLDRLVVPA